VIKKTGIMLLLLTLMGAPLSAGAPGSGLAPSLPERPGQRLFGEIPVTTSGSISRFPKGAKLSAFIAYPERKTKAPIVIVIHEVYGLTDWIRAVADRLAGTDLSR
jgi:carboxymethylenebutenolidase